MHPNTIKKAKELSAMLKFEVVQAEVELSKEELKSEDDYSHETVLDLEYKIDYLKTNIKSLTKLINKAEFPPKKWREV